MSSTITSKGQLTIPKRVREKMRLRTGTKVDFIATDHGTYEIVALTGSIQDAKGILPTPERAATLEEMDDAVAEAVAEGDNLQ
ncbi:AbrB/MazE/SpoVT family DNA-binding domain-containing protein [Salininema proteolyticum]|uniref:AbrB/MazE/SpoVT family DNA-binding domain-containing protein n=1 Tax=Salininema proteolyticum TaxID=1607685 RepID=A0ABV8U2S6_9ACTN